MHAVPPARRIVTDKAETREGLGKPACWRIEPGRPQAGAPQSTRAVPFNLIIVATISRVRNLRDHKMIRLYHVIIEKLPLPVAPLRAGHIDRGLTLSGKPDEYSTESEALNRARALIQAGYRISILDPDGQTWTHEKVLARLSIAA